jgi:hypothetical protein
MLTRRRQGLRRAARACRHCRSLAYSSQNENPWLRNLRWVRKIRILGGGADIVRGDAKDCVR